MYKLFLAYRYLTNRKIMFFCVAGIAVGVMALIVVTSVMGGFSREVRARIRGTSAHLSLTNQNSYFIYDYEKIMESIRALPDVAGCAPRLEWGALLGKGLEFVQIIGIEPKLEAETSEFRKYLVAGSPEDFPTPTMSGPGTSPPPAIIGSQIYGIPPYSFKDDRNVLKDTTISLTSIRLMGMIPVPVHRDFRVVGVFSTGMVEYDNNIYIPLKVAQEFLGVNNGVTRIAVKLKDYNKAKIVAEQIRRITGDLYYIQTWEDEKRTLLRAVAIEKNINAVILFFIVIVAGFNIMAILTMRVVEKTHDIGIIKSLGGTTGGVAWLFLYQGLLIALLGCIIGVIIGFAITLNLNAIADGIHKQTGFEVFPKDVYMLTAIPYEINPLAIVIIIAATIAMSVLFSIYPAVKAARLEPVEALKYE